MATVLWIGDAGCHTGFARVSHSIGDRLVTDFGHDVHALAVNYRGDYWPTPMKLYRPNMLDYTDIWGRSRMIEMLGKVDPDVVVMLADANIMLQLLFENQYDVEKYLLRYRPILAYVPVDGYNLPPAWSNVLTKVANVVAMSRFGQEAYPGSKLVYHGVDSDLFRPISEKDPLTLSTGQVVKSKREAKEAFGYDPDGFMVLRVDKNSGRKDFAATWKALVPVMKKYSDIICHFHTTDRGGNSGLTLNALFSREENLVDRFKLPDQFDSFLGWEQSDLIALYNAADLFVTTSRGEGFGLTIAEALACGVPVIAQNVSAIPEVVGPGGILLEPERMITVPSGEDQWLADIPAFTQAIEHLYLSGGVRRKLGAAGRDHVVNSFSWDVAATRMDYFITALAAGVPEPVVEQVG